MWPEGRGVGKAGARKGVRITELALVVVGAMVVGVFVMLVVMMLTLLIVMMLTLSFANAVAAYMTVEVRAWVLIREVSLLAGVILQTPAKTGEICVPYRDDDSESSCREDAYKEDCNNRE
jgi:hypothetical protein